MPRVRTKRPKQGARLAALRKAAGLSQYELARAIGVPQPNIAYWELSEKPPRSDVLPKMAKTLGVSVETLLEFDTPIEEVASMARPTGKMRKVFDEVARLPRRQQDKIAEVVTALVTQYDQSRQS